MRFAALVPALGLPALALACGSMGLNEPRNQAVLGLAIFLPMLALVPVEMGLLLRLGGLRGRVLKAYLACLPAKAAGVLGVALAAEAGSVDGVIAAELVYSAGHLLVAASVLALGFGLRGRILWPAAVSISTVIPWLYSLGFWQIIRLLD